MGWRATMGLASTLLWAGCAAPGAASGRADRVGPPFAEVRTVVVYRPPASEPRRGKDVLDGLAETLASRGLRVSEAGSDPALGERLLDLHRRLERWDGPALTSRGAARVGVHEGAGEVVRALGADAVAFAYRFLRTPSLGTLPGLTPRFASPGESPTRALGALVLASARDDVVRVEWGDGAGLSTTGPASAAEAIEVVAELLRAPEEPAPAP